MSQDDCCTKVAALEETVVELRAQVAELERQIELERRGYGRPDAVVLPRPAWADLPAEAQWWCVGPTGHVGWSVDEPQYDLASHTANWFSYSGVWFIRFRPGMADEFPRVIIPLGVDWRTLKERRPDGQLHS